MLVSRNAYKKRLMERESVSGPVVWSRLKFIISGAYFAGAVAAGVEFASLAIRCVRHKPHVSMELKTFYYVTYAGYKRRFVSVYELQFY
jgi:hypothetical protein